MEQPGHATVQEDDAPGGDDDELQEAEQEPSQQTRTGMRPGMALQNYAEAARNSRSRQEAEAAREVERRASAAAAQENEQQEAGQQPAQQTIKGMHLGMAQPGYAEAARISRIRQEAKAARAVERRAPGAAAAAAALDNAQQEAGQRRQQQTHTGMGPEMEQPGHATAQEDDAPGANDDELQEAGQQPSQQPSKGMRPGMAQPGYAEAAQEDDAPGADDDEQREAEQRPPQQGLSKKQAKKLKKKAAEAVEAEKRAEESNLLSRAAAEAESARNARLQKALEEIEGLRKSAKDNEQIIRQFEKALNGKDETIAHLEKLLKNEQAAKEDVVRLNKLWLEKVGELQKTVKSNGKRIAELEKRGHGK